MVFNILQIPNDVLLFLILITVIGALVYEEFHQEGPQELSEPFVEVEKNYHTYCVPPPVFSGRPKLVPNNMTLQALNRYMPHNDVRSPKKIPKARIRPLHTQVKISKKLPQPAASGDIRTAETIASGEIQPENSRLKYVAIGLPNNPGCEPTSPACKQMMTLFPDAYVPDIIRFLVARKGNVELASDMMRKASGWLKDNLPLKCTNEEIKAAFNTGCFFLHGTARDGSPVLYMRGALYDNSKASAEAHVLAAAHTIDYAVKHSQHINVTVLVHAVNVPGAPNASADTKFIKGFVQVLSDNFPERLNKLVLYPFPWYGRAIWSVIKMFVDKRTQDKVNLMSHSGTTLPKELTDIVDPNEIPVCCGGLDTRPILDLTTTLV